MRGFALAALTLLALGFLPKTSARQTGAPNLSVSLESEPWTLAFNIKDFEIKTNGLQPDGRAYLEAENEKTGVTLSAYLERVQAAATPVECAENQKRRREEKVDYKREKIETKESLGMAILEFTIPQFEGIPVQQRNLFACLPKDDVYADIHLSKVNFKSQDEGLFTAILASVSFVQKTPSSEK